MCYSCILQIGKLRPGGGKAGGKAWRGKLRPGGGNDRIELGTKSPGFQSMALTSQFLNSDCFQTNSVDHLVNLLTYKRETKS